QTRRSARELRLAPQSAAAGRVPSVAADLLERLSLGNARVADPVGRFCTSRLEHQRRIRASLSGPAAHSPRRMIGSAPPSHTPSTSRSPDPIMKSTWMALRFPPARSNAASSIDSPPRIVNLYAVPSATWLAAFSSNSVL